MRFTNVQNIEFEVRTNLDVDVIEEGYELEDSDLQVKLRFDRATHRILADFSALVKVVNAQDPTKFATFKFADSSQVYGNATIYARLTKDYVGAHTFEDAEYEYLFDGAIDDLGSITITFE